MQHSLEGLEVVGVGAGSRDYYLPVFGGSIRNQRYEHAFEFRPGDKDSMSPWQLSLFDEISRDPEVVVKNGGNMLNALAALAVCYGPSDVSVAMALGERDVVSHALSDELVALGIRNTAAVSSGYAASVGVVVRAQDSDGAIMDRTVYGSRVILSGCCSIKNI